MCWQTRVLAIDGKSVESSQTLGSSVRTTQQEETTGGRKPWAAASRASCAEAGPGSQSRCLEQSPVGGEGCLPVAHGFKFFKSFIQQVFTKLF